MSDVLDTPAPRASAFGGSGRRNALGTLAVLVATGIVILAAVYLSQPNLGDSSGSNYTPVDVGGQAAGVAPTIGETAPQLAGTLPDGTLFQLTDLRGTPVWVTFGASWCQPCRAENPDIEATYETYADRVAVVQVYMSEDASSVADYAQRVGITYTTVPDPFEQLATEYRIVGIPSHFFIDADGILRQVKVGSLNPATMTAALEAIIR